jgi:hypothetical protein
MKRKQNALATAAISGIVCVAAAIAAGIGYLTVWLAEILLIVAFPVFIIALALWWSASEGEADIPFIGY